MLFAENLWTFAKHLANAQMLSDLPCENMHLLEVPGVSNILGP